MSLLYGRNVRVSVGPSGGGPGIVWGRDGLLRIDFNIAKTDKSKPNQGTIQLYNLNDASRGFIEDDRSLVVRLYAGYGDDEPPLIFLGEITEVESGKDDLDMITTITARDGIKAFQGGTLSKSYAAGVTSTQVVLRVAAAMDLRVATTPINLKVISYPTGYTVMGPGRAVLDEVLGSLGAKWSIQDDALIITLENEPSTTPAFRIAESSGLIGTPEKVKKGVKFSSLLQGAIVPRGLVRLESAVKPDLSGWVVPKKVDHVGSNWDGDFRTDVEGFLTPTGNNG